VRVINSELHDSPECAMPNYHREVYQPPHEDGPVYDLRDEEVEDSRSRLPLLILAALVVVAAFAGVVWLAYNQGMERGREGSPVVIAAPEGAIREAPGAQDAAPLTGLKVYSDPVPPDAEAETSTLAAPTETAPPMVAEVPPPAVRPGQTIDPATPAPVQPAPVAQPPAPVAQNPAPATQAAQAPSGSALIQVASFPSRALAEDAFTKFKARFGSVVGNVSPNIQEADLGEKGIWYRLRVGPFIDKEAAAATCESLKAQGGSCFAASP